MADVITTDLTGILDEIRSQLAELSGRIAKLEGATKVSAAPPAPAPAPKPAEVKPAEPKPAEEAISEETLLAISAAVAAFLGERVHIRQIRVVSSPAWAQQGRVWIQASHRLH